eukprot:4689642-Amphidinium_carterae.2
MSTALTDMLTKVHLSVANVPSSKRILRSHAHKCCATAATLPSGAVCADALPMNLESGIVPQHCDNNSNHLNPLLPKENHCKR